MNLREKHGWTYGAGGSFQYRRDGSLLSLTAAVRVDASGPSVSEMVSEINTIRASPVTLDELAREKEGDILELPARWSTGKSIANTLQTLQYYGLPLNWYDGYAARVQAVDLAALQKAARDHLDVDAAVVLIVGDFKKITPQIEALISSGPLAGQVVHRLDTDGKPLPALAK
jgi:predicted Zn-dependent peptidase